MKKKLSIWSPANNSNSQHGILPGKRVHLNHTHFLLIDDGWRYRFLNCSADVITWLETMVRNPEPQVLARSCARRFGAYILHNAKPALGSTHCHSTAGGQQGDHPNRQGQADGLKAQFMLSLRARAGHDQLSQSECSEARDGRSSHSIMFRH